MTKKLRWKLTDKTGKIISRHYTKKQAQKAQAESGKAKVYLRKV
jgi:hypothetical protein